MCTLRDEAAGSVWLFMDDNQRVYDAMLDVPPEFRPYDLTVNCRNTQAIHREVMKLYEGAIVPEVKGPPGREIELLHTDDAPATVAAVLERLCGQEEVPPQDITVLSSHGFDRSRVAREAGGRYRLVKERGQLGRRVNLSSIRGFKGLESPVVVLCELEGLDDMTQDQQLYVGLSRAKNHCVVVAPGAA
ncbi:MAG: ATP-binding domain-containing protein [Thermoleophilaceae bacterium]